MTVNTYCRCNVLFLVNHMVPKLLATHMEPKLPATWCLSNSHMVPKLLSVNSVKVAVYCCYADALIFTVSVF